MSSTLPPDPYKILGVAKDAQIAEIRSAHRKLILKCHPDKVQDAELKVLKADEFQKVQQAYELLSDDNERAKYDDSVKLAELRRQMQSKANTSSPRTVPKYADIEIRTAEPRPSTFKASPQMPPRSKTYHHAYSRSYEEDIGRGPRIIETEIRTSRKEATFSGRKPSKRDREKDRDRDSKSDRERHKENARLAEKVAEKEMKEIRRAEKRKTEKAKDKEIKAATEDKKRSAKPYVEYYDEEVPSPRSSEKKKSSSAKKYEEKRERERERSLPREMPPSMPPQSRSFTGDKTVHAAYYAASYIEAARGKNRSGPSRNAPYYAAHSVQPPVPTPPPAKPSAFPTPEDEEEVRRSSARTRRGSGEAPRPSREGRYRKGSREADDGVYVIHTSPSARHTAQFDTNLSSSPKSMHPHPPTRTNTMPMDGYTRSIPVPPARARTFGGYGQPEPPSRGRDRSRMNPQFEEVSDDDEEYDRRRSERKHRSSKKTRSPEARDFREHTYQVQDGRTVFASTYSRNPTETGASQYYPTGSTGIYMTEPRPSMSREASYMSRSSGAKFDKFKQSKEYDYGDVAYSDYPQQYQRDYTAAIA